VVGARNRERQAGSRISLTKACSRKGTETFARSADWRVEADRILAAVKPRG